MSPDRQEVVRRAMLELQAEAVRKAVEAEKQRILDEQSRHRWWHRFIPFTITINRRAT